MRSHIERVEVFEGAKPAVKGDRNCATTFSIKCRKLWLVLPIVLQLLAEVIYAAEALRSNVQV